MKRVCGNGYELFISIVASAVGNVEPQPIPAQFQASRAIGVILPPSQKETYENSFYLEAIRGISHSLYR